jgi:polyadenylate-binding protein 2
MADIESTQPTTNGNPDPTIDDGDDAETNVRRITP